MRDAINRGTMFNVIPQPTRLKVNAYACATDFDHSAVARRLTDTLLIDPGARRFSIATAEDVIRHKLHWFRIGGVARIAGGRRPRRPADPARHRSRRPSAVGRSACDHRA